MRLEDGPRTIENSDVQTEARHEQAKPPPIPEPDHKTLGPFPVQGGTTVAYGSATTQPSHNAANANDSSRDSAKFSVTQITFPRPSLGNRIRFDEDALAPSLSPYMGPSLTIQNTNTFWAVTQNIDARAARAREELNHRRYHESAEIMRPHFREGKFDRMLDGSRVTKCTEQGPDKNRY